MSKKVILYAWLAEDTDADDWASRAQDALGDVCRCGGKVKHWYTPWRKSCEFVCITSEVVDVLPGEQDEVMPGLEVALLSTATTSGNVNVFVPSTWVWVKP